MAETATAATTQASDVENPDLAPLSEQDQQALQEETEAEAARLASQSTTQASGGVVLPTCKEMRDLLSQPIPKRLLKTMKNYGGSGVITYLHWTTVKKFLDLRSPGWQYFVKGVVTTEIGVAVTTEIHIPCADGTLIGSGVGFEPHRQGKDNKPTGFGGAAVVAERQAMKRSAAILGLGFSLYEG